MGKHQLVLGGQSVEFVLGGFELFPGEKRYLLGNLLAEALGSVQAGAHSGSPKSQLPQTTWLSY